MADDVSQGDTRKHPAKAKGFRVLNKRVCLPRYAYHKWLVDWSLEGADLIKGFIVDPITECMVLVGGDLSKESESLLSSENAGGDCLSDCTTEMVVGDHLILVYFMTQDDVKKIGSLVSYLKMTSEELQYKEADLLLILPTDFKHSSTEIISNALRSTEQLRIARVFSVKKQSQEIRHSITKTLESNLNRYLCHVEGRLSNLSSAESVDECLEKVRAVIKRLGKALCFPNQHKPEKPYDKGQVLNIIERFQDKILYHGFNKKGARIITTDESVKDDLSKLLSKVENLKVEINVRKHLTMTPLSFHQQGTKFVFKDQSPETFLYDADYATIGSLVKRNGFRMAALTCQHPFLGKQNPSVFVNINGSVVKLGSDMFHAHSIKSVIDDFALIDVDLQTIPIIETHCEKRLLDFNGQPATSDISDCPDAKDLYELVDEIVHKRGAATQFTTGKIKEAGRIHHEINFPDLAPAFIVKPLGENRFFANHGDSGSLVFLPSLSIENRIVVLGMVCFRAPEEIFNDPCLVLCVPLREAVDNLINKVPDIDGIDFYQQ